MTLINLYIDAVCKYKEKLRGFRDMPVRDSGIDMLMTCRCFKVIFCTQRFVGEH